MDAHPFVNGGTGLTGRSRIVALQAVVVAGLLVVVYLTILRPSDNGDVSPVSAPGPRGNAATPAAPPDRQAGDRPAATRPRRPARAAPPRSATGTATAAPPITVPAAPIARVPPPPVGEGEGGTPADEQYSDMLARLNAALK